MTYPETRAGTLVENYHGVDVPAPYRWLENPDSKESQTWIAAQNKVTDSYLKSAPQRKAIEARMTQLWNYEKVGLPIKHGSRYFFTKNDGVQDQAVLYWSTQVEGEANVLLDPNVLAADGTVALADISISHDGTLLAYGLQSAGSDWVEWKVKKVESGDDLSDSLSWVKFSRVAWTHDNLGFYYSRYPEPSKDESLTEANYNQKLYYHQLGTEQSSDALIMERADEPTWGFMPSVSDDGAYLSVSVWKGTGNQNHLFIKDLRKPKSKPVALFKAFDAEYRVIGNQGNRFWFFTDKDAARGKIISSQFTAANPKKNLRTVFAESKDTLSGASLVGGKLILSYLKDAQSRVAVASLDGRLEKDIKLPGIGSVSGFEGRIRDPETFFQYTSFTTPTENYRYNITTGETTLYAKPEVDFDSSQYTTEQVFVTSKDGTRVPMFITHKKGVKRDGNAPTLLYGYGGFNISLTPGFSVTRAVWLEMGGVYAVANLRGGGEYGESWHLAGTKLNKQNVFDDFVASAEWLIDQEVTNPKKLAIQGRSNGGLLVGAAITQRPDLFGAALPGVGVMDMLRFHKFTIGWAWVDDYGSSDNADEFKALYAYSPLHNAKPATYPATLITTGDHDDRVVPGHSFKFAAALQEANTGPNPTLIRIDTRAGHGAGKPTQMVIGEYSEMWTFLAKSLKVTLPPGFGSKQWGAKSH